MAQIKKRNKPKRSHSDVIKKLLDDDFFYLTSSEIDYSIYNLLVFGCGEDLWTYIWINLREYNEET